MLKVSLSSPEQLQEFFLWIPCGQVERTVVNSLAITVVFWFLPRRRQDLPRRLDGLIHAWQASQLKSTLMKTF